MDWLIDTVSTWLTGPRAQTLLDASIALVLGVVFARLMGVLLGRFVTTRFGASQGILARRVVWYGLLFVVLTTTLRQFGLDLGVLLGAAGILTVAIGFASQTSASNLISGLFLLAERPFTVSDVITVGTTTGEVISIDLLSVRLRTYDNLLVRIPNETLLKSEIRNLAGFPIRRIDIPMLLEHDVDLERVVGILVALADDNPLCLDEPRPQFQCVEFTDSAIRVQFSVWVMRENLVPVKTAVFIDTQKAFAAAGIALARPRRVIEHRPADPA